VPKVDGVWRDGSPYPPRGQAWVVKTYDKDLITQLNADCRKGKYKDDLFKQYTGKDLDTLFDEFKKSLAKK
jgi:hypothetical protein